MKHQLPALSRHERRTLSHILERLIPSDETGPGAGEADVGRYIESALRSAYRTHAPAYTNGLRALEAYAERTRGKPFTKLSSRAQDATLSEVEHGQANDAADLAAFFRLVLTHAMEGMFGDPVHGGNAHKVGWALIGYPGPQTVWADSDQAIDDAAPVRL